MFCSDLSSIERLPVDDDDNHNYDDDAHSDDDDDDHSYDDDDGNEKGQPGWLSFSDHPWLAICPRKATS